MPRRPRQNLADLVGRIDLHPSRRKLLLVGVTLIVVGLALGGIDREAPRAPEIPASTVLDLDLPSREPALPPATPEPLAGDAPLPASEEPTVALADMDWERVEVRRGQTLDAIFRQQGFSVGLLHEILALGKETRGLTKIRPGEAFDFRRHDDGSLATMRYPLAEDQWLMVEVADGEPSYRTDERAIEIREAEADGTINSSLFVAGKTAGMSDAMVMKLANIFGWDIDFVLDIREGDRFVVIYERLYREGEFLRDGDILAATFINQGERFQALRFDTGEGPQYFAPDGRNMRKAFLRAPLNFSYISSNFNPKRFHPVLKRIKPHRGIDYRAPTGTPVYAAGDGKVIRSANDNANGHHVFIQHANSIVTKYLHFTKRTVKKGQRVRQGQTIGHVGSTGLSTAPHLHYEFVVNGVHRNPRTVPLPKADPLGGDMLARFQSHAAPWLTRLSRLESASLYASRD